MSEKTLLRWLAIQAMDETIDAIYDSGFRPDANWKQRFIDTYDKMVKSYQQDVL